jgi:hypothetical protein
MRHFFSIVTVILFVNKLSAQNDIIKEIKGKILVEAVDIDGIYIINLRSEVTATTQNGGYFTIPVTVGDTLMFSAFQIKGKRVVVTEKDFAKELFLVKLDPMINRLDEVIIHQYKNIDAVAMGIIPASTKRYTPAERKLRTASNADLKGNENGTSGAFASLDPLFNWMSGRTAMLEKELQVEKKETLLQKIENQFGYDFFIEKLHIPKDYVKGFWYYVVDESKFVSALNAKNINMANFVLTELSTKYLELLKTETK